MKMIGKEALRHVRKYYPNVIEVKDAKQDATVNVTAMDCKNGIPKQPNSCAIAKAFQRQYDGAIIARSVAYLVTGNKAERFRISQPVSEQLLLFDKHSYFSPGFYWLNAPGPSDKMQSTISIRAKRTSRRGAFKVYRKRHMSGIRVL